MNATTTRAREMSEAERRERHARSIALLETSTGLSNCATVFGVMGIIFWWLIPVALLFLSAAVIVSRHADEVSPYGGKS